MSMYDPKKLRMELVRDEGLRLDAYKDTLGYWTIGIGHLLGTDKRMTKITEREAYALLQSDIEEALATLDRIAIWWVALDPLRQRVLINMAFNLGSRLAQFKNTLRAMRENDFAGAAAGMRNSLWARQVKGRAERLATMMETGIDPIE